VDIDHERLARPELAARGRRAGAAAQGLEDGAVPARSLTPVGG